MDTRAERVERLQKNERAYFFLSNEDKIIMEDAKEENRVSFLDPVGTWMFQPRISFEPNGVYHIHKDYQPEPDKPNLGGYTTQELLSEIQRRLDL